MSQLKRRRRAFARFYRLHEEKLLSALRIRARRLAWGDVALAEDLVQEGLVALWEVADRLHGYRHPLRTALHFGTRRMRRFIATHELRIDREVDRQQQQLEALSSRRRDKAAARQRRALGDRWGDGSGDDRDDGAEEAA